MGQKEYDICVDYCEFTDCTNCGYRDKPKNIFVKPYKCQECDPAFCEYWLWCKGENVDE